MKTEVKLIFHPTLGKIHFRKSRKARYLRLSIDSSKKIKVIIPRNSTIRNAEKFLQSKTDWINKQFIKIDLRNNFTLNNIMNSKIYAKEEAKKIIRTRLNELSQIHGLNFNRSFIRSQKTRWGSCSAKNNINLNIKLINLPEELRDYVIIHELVHTRVKNHGQQFWAEMTKYYQYPKMIDKKLRNYNLKLM